MKPIDALVTLAMTVVICGSLFMMVRGCQQTDVFRARADACARIAGELHGEDCVRK